MRFRFGARGNKYGAKRVEVDGMSFDSMWEAEYYSQLKEMKIAGVVSFFLRQAPIHLPGGVRYVVDFLVFYSNGEVEFIDAKGIETKEFKTKKKLVEALYPFEIRVVKKRGNKK